MSPRQAPQWLFPKAIAALERSIVQQKPEGNSKIVTGKYVIHHLRLRTNQNGALAYKYVELHTYIKYILYIYMHTYLCIDMYRQPKEERERERVNSEREYNIYYRHL